MTRRDIAEQVSRKTGVTTNIVYNLLGEALKVMSDGLVKNKKLYLRGFGTFSTVRRKAKQARNICEGTPMSLPAQTVPHFKASKLLKRKIKLSKKA